MVVKLDKINPTFRQLTDLLFFSDRVDLDLSEFRSLLKENYNEHYAYVWDRLQKCTDIFWENGEQFWSHRFAFLFSLNEKLLTKNLEEHLEKRMFNLVRNKAQIHIKYDIEHLQFVEFCKIKYLKGENLSKIKNYLIALPSHSNTEKLINIVSPFTPFIFENLNDYANQLSLKIAQSSRNFDFLLALEKIAPSNFLLDRVAIAKLAQEIICGRSHNDKNCRTFFKLIDDAGVMSLLKKEYEVAMRPKLLALLTACDYQMIEDFHLRNIKNILELDAYLSDNIVEIYAEKLYQRSSGHKKANADKLIRLVKTFPQMSPKKILSFLSANNKISDIKYILTSFPELKKLAAFV